MAILDPSYYREHREKLIKDLMHAEQTCTRTLMIPLNYKTGPELRHSPMPIIRNESIKPKDPTIRDLEGKIRMMAIKTIREEKPKEDEMGSYGQGWVTKPTETPKEPAITFTVEMTKDLCEYLCITEAELKALDSTIKTRLMGCWDQLENDLDMMKVHLVAYDIPRSLSK